MLLDPFNGWGEFTLALAAFLGTHVIPSRPAIRGRLISVAGERTYLIAYRLVSLFALGWLISASANASYVELWPYSDWQRFAPQAAMPVATILAVFALSSPNPLSIGSKGVRTFDPAHPGIVGFVRHPLLWAILVWSVAHLVPNGDLAHVALFELFALLSIAGMLTLDRRSRRRLGEAEWRRLAWRTSNVPLVSLVRGWNPRPSAGVAAKLLAGLALYALLLFTHPIFAGVPAILA